jgi:hypothetical protein
LTVSFLQDSLAEIIAKLINHDLSYDGSNIVDQTFCESNPFRRLGFMIFQSSWFLSARTFRYLILDHLLEHSASSLVKAIEIESVENISLLSGELRKKRSHLLIRGLGRLENLRRSVLS